VIRTRTAIAAAIVAAELLVLAACSGGDDDAADGNRSPVRPGPLLSGPAGAGSASEDDQPLGREGLGVADGAVDDPTKDALVNPDLADQVPEVTLAVDDEDVADLAAGTLTNRSRRSWGARSEGSAR